MSHLDRAFIKAFDKRDQPRPASAPSNRRAPAAGVQAAAPSVLSQTATVTVEAPQPLPVRQPASPSGDRSGIQSVPAPHLRVLPQSARPEARPESRPAFTEHPSPPKPHMAAPALAPILQKMEPAPQPQALQGKNDIQLSRELPAEEKLRAAFEVELFPWPETCMSLLKRAETEFRVFANELMAAAATGSRVVLITSLGRGEGRTTMLLCLGKLLADQGRNVLIADGDFQQPHLARQLKLLPQAGWDEVLAGEMPLDEALIESMGDHVTLMPLRQSLTNPSLLSGASALEDNLKQLARHFELVLVDAGSLDANHSGMRALGAAHGSSSVVVRDMRNSAPEYDVQVRQYMQAAGITRWSLAENFIHS